MRVTHRMLAHAVNRNLKHNMHALNKYSNQLSTGRVFDRPSQDPVGTYKVMRIAGTGLARNEQYRRNIGEGISWLSSTEDALAGTIDALQRLREISVYAANEMFTAADRLAVAPEVNQLLDYLVSLGNTELAGLYIFGGHRTEQKPYAIAGAGGDMIDIWHNLASGLDKKVGAGTGIVVENLATGNYAVSTAASEQVAHLGYARFEGAVTAPGAADNNYVLQFNVDGVIYQVRGTVESGASASETVDTFVNAINNKSGLKDYIRAEKVEGTNLLRVERIDGGGKSFSFWGDMEGAGATAINGLAGHPADPGAAFNPSLQNITSLDGITQNDFLEGIYKVVTDNEMAPVNSVAKVEEYFRIAGNEAATVAANGDNELNVSFFVEIDEITEEGIILSYKFETLAKDGSTADSGSGTLGPIADGADLAGEINALVGGDVFNNFILPTPEELRVGDKLVANVSARANDGDDGVAFHRDGKEAAAFVFNNVSGQAVDFKFFQLDTDPKSPTYGFTPKAATTGAVPSAIQLSFADVADGGLLKTTPANPAASFTVGPTVTVVTEYLQGAREGFFGTDKIRITNNSDAELTGSIALEIMEAVRYQDLSDARKAQIGGEVNDRIIRLSVRSLLQDLGGTPYEGTYGLRDGEDIYINLNQLRDGGQQIAFSVGGKNVSLNITGLEPLTFEHDISLVGDKMVLQISPPAAFTSTADKFDRFSLHRDYGALDESGRPTTGEEVSWYFRSDESVFDGRTSVLKFFDINPISGNLFTSTLKAKFDTFATAEAVEYRDREEILAFGVPDEEYGKYPASIFTFIAEGEAYYQGDGGQRLVEIAPGVDVPVNISGLNAFDPRGIDGVGLFQAVNTMYQALIHNNRDALGGQVLIELDENLDNLLRNRSELGARMERFLVTENRHHSEHIFLRELRTKIEDIDMADVITEFSLQEVAYQSALATGARMIYPSLIDFLR